MIDRVYVHWRSTVAGLLSCAGVVFGVCAVNFPGAKWVAVGSGIVAGLTGLLARDR